MVYPGTEELQAAFESRPELVDRFVTVPGELLAKVAELSVYQEHDRFSQGVSQQQHDSMQRAASVMTPHYHGTGMELPKDAARMRDIGGRTVQQQLLQTGDAVAMLLDPEPALLRQLAVKVPELADKVSKSQARGAVAAAGAVLLLLQLLLPAAAAAAAAAAAVHSVAAAGSVLLQLQQQLQCSH